MRHLNLLEYQSKGLLQESNVAIQAFRVVESNKDEKALNDFRKTKIINQKICLSKIKNIVLLLDAPEYVVKAQILAGGRGKGHFSNGFKGGVHITKE